MNAPTLKTLTLIIATLPYAALAENTATPKLEQTTELQTVNVTGKNRSTRTENRDSYTTSAMRTTTGLALSPKETPQSVSVITKTQLDNQGMTNMEQALKTTTGINVIPDSGRWRYQSRGFYIDQIEEDGLSTTVAGSSGNPYNDPQSMSNLAIYDHIEVVRGPTGLTQSNSEPGGTINAVRKRPTANTQATLSFMADRFGAAGLIGDVSGSLNSSHSVRGRLVSSLTRNKTFQDKNPTKGQMLYGILEADIGENSKATLGGLYQRTEETPDFYGVPMGNGFDLTLPRDTYLGAEWNQIRFYKRNVFAEFDHQINDNWKWSSKLNYNRSSSAQNFATAANTGGRFAGIGQNGIFTGATDNIQKYDNTGKQFAFQTGVSGKFQALGNEQQAFANYTYSRENNSSYNLWKARTSNEYNIFDYDWKSVARTNWTSGNANYTDTERTITNHAVSTGVLFTPWHKLHILGALRYTHWAYDFDNRKTGKLSEYRKSSLVPYLGITFDVDKNHSIYANYTQIKKPQTNRDMDNNLLNPITGTNTEIGFKSDWFGNGRLNSSFALYQIIQKNRPYDLDKRNAIGEWAYQAIGKVQSRGFEAELSGDLTEDWKISANYAFNMSKYKESEGARYPIGTNFSKHTPKHMFRLYTSYRLPFADRKWTIGGGMTVQSKTNSLWNVGQGGYLLWNADVHYTPTKNLNLSLIGSNLGNRRYYENHRIRTMGINNIYGQPRNIMFKVDYKF